MTTSHITPLDTLDEATLTENGDRLDASPENVREVLAGYDSAKFLENVAVMYSLTDQQHRGVARFLMEIILGNVPTSEMAPELSRIAGVDTNTAVQIIKELESGLLSPLGLTLTGLAAPAAEPELVIDEKGKEGLRYASADDLLADIVELSPSERDRFLADAKHDNRIIVLQVLSQLKLGADGAGSPLSFRQLVSAEAEDFGPVEWSDLARSDPDAFSEPEILRHIEATPLGTMLQGRDPTAARNIVLKFRELDDDARKIAVDPATTAAIQELVRPGLVPQTHTPAVARIVFFVLTGQATNREVSSLLAKVGLNAAAADAAARVVSELTASAVQTEPEIAVPDIPRTPGLNVPNTAGRTILDLRKPQP